MERVVTMRYHPNNLKIQYDWVVYGTGFPSVALGLISTPATTYSKVLGTHTLQFQVQLNTLFCKKTTGWASEATELGFSHLLILLCSLIKNICFCPPYPDPGPKIVLYSKLINYLHTGQDLRASI